MYLWDRQCIHKHTCICATNHMHMYACTHAHKHVYTLKGSDALLEQSMVCEH